MSVDHMAPLAKGMRLDDRYEVEGKLSEGGMASIYLVRHRALGSLHVVKVPARDIRQEAEARERFTQEGQIQAGLDHPHIVQVTDIVVDPVPGLIMKYVEGDTLDDFCGKSPDRRLSLPMLKEIFLPVLNAMEAAHRSGVIHRDLKPSNILLGKGAQGQIHPMVTDFGIAKAVREESRQKYPTRDGSFMGTAQYMSPEQFNAAAQVDARSDIFSLGAILYELVTGQEAFAASSTSEAKQRIVTGDFTPPEKLVPNLPSGLFQCIRKALAVDPALRFQGCAEFRAAIKQALEVAPPVPTTVKLPEPPRTAQAAPSSVLPPQRSYAAGMLLFGGLSVFLFLGCSVLSATLERERTENKRLKGLHQSEVDGNHALRQASLVQARSCEAKVQTLETNHREAVLKLQEQEQLNKEVQVFKSNALNSMGITLTDLARDMERELYQVVKTCNMTGSEVYYQAWNPQVGWSEWISIRPKYCRMMSMPGYYGEVLLQYKASLSGGKMAQGHAMAGMVSGRSADVNSDWRPWENHLVLDQSGGLQLQLKFRPGQASAGGGTQTQ